MRSWCFGASKSYSSCQFIDTKCGIALAEKRNTAENIFREVEEMRNKTEDELGGFASNLDNKKGSNLFLIFCPFVLLVIFQKNN